jgi:hypothetical protein
VARISETKRFLNDYLVQLFESLVLEITSRSSSTTLEDFLSNVFVAGGAITSLFEKEKPNDIDIYFRNADYAKLFIREILANNSYLRPALSVVRNTNITSEKFVSNTESLKLNISKQAFDELNKNLSRGTRSYFFSENAISVQLSKKVIPAQFILRFVGEPEDVLSCFDFSHTKNFLIPGRELFVSPRALLSQTTKDLRYEGSFFPLTSVVRTKKFLSRGWNCSGGEYLKIILQLSELDWTDKKVLFDQLQGVDTYYFTQLISEIEKEVPEGQPVSKQMVLEKLDKIFP